jgi:uncharacterized protein YceK
MRTFAYHILLIGMAAVFGGCASVRNITITQTPTPCPYNRNRQPRRSCSSSMSGLM